MLHSHHKAHRLEADLERMTEVVGLIVTLAESGSATVPAGSLLSQIARLGHAALAGATPPASKLVDTAGQTR